MKSVMGSKRPNCIIVDEVDGTAGGSDSKNAVHALVKLVYGGAGGTSALSIARWHPCGVPTYDQGELPDSHEHGFTVRLLGAGVAGEAGATGPGGRKAKQRALCRPVIAICNELYAPVLRPLRARAAVFQFRNPSVLPSGIAPPTHLALQIAQSRERGQWCAGHCCTSKTCPDDRHVNCERPA